MHFVTCLQLFALFTVYGWAERQLVRQNISGNTGTFTSPGYPGPYPNNVNYTWILTTGHTSASVNVTIDKIQIHQPCVHNFLEITEQEPCCFTALKRCGEFEPFNITTRGNVIRITFVSDEQHHTAKGFFLKWQVILTNESKTTSINPGDFTKTTQRSITSAPTNNKIFFTGSTSTTNTKEKGNEDHSILVAHFTPIYDSGTTFKTDTVFLVIGIGIVEITLIALGVCMAIQCRKRASETSSLRRNQNDSIGPVSQKTIYSVANVYESIPLEHFSVEDTIQEEEESPYVGVADNVYDRAFVKRPYVGTKSI